MMSGGGSSMEGPGGSSVAPFVAKTYQMVDHTVIADKYFATGEEDFDPEHYPKIYVMAQCAPTMTASQGWGCLQAFVGTVPSFVAAACSAMVVLQLLACGRRPARPEKEPLLRHGADGQSISDLASILGQQPALQRLVHKEAEPGRRGTRPRPRRRSRARGTRLACRSCGQRRSSRGYVASGGAGEQAANCTDASHL